MANYNYGKRKGSGYYHIARRNAREESPLYKKFRAIVRKRDKTCQMPGCDHKCGKLQVHHIFQWADCPLSRYEEKNGILLCKACHDNIRGREGYYIELFTKIVMQKYDNTN